MSRSSLRSAGASISNRPIQSREPEWREWELNAYPVERGAPKPKVNRYGINAQTGAGVVGSQLKNTNRSRPRRKKTSTRAPPGCIPITRQRANQPTSPKAAVPRQHHDFSGYEPMDVPKLTMAEKHAQWMSYQVNSSRANGASSRAASSSDMLTAMNHERTEKKHGHGHGGHVHGPGCSHDHGHDHMHIHGDDEE